MMLLIDISRSLNPPTASDTIFESHLRIISRIPTSRANCTPSFNAFASVSRGPNGIGNFLLSATSTRPSLSGGARILAQKGQN